MNNKTILITGASGFLGTWLADKAYEMGYKLIGIDLRAPLRPKLWERFVTSSCETVDFNQLLQDQPLYAVCHLAGAASVAGSVSDPFGDFSSLIPGTCRLSLYLAKYHPQARLFLFSSAAVYGNPKTLPITEDTPVLPISPYGIHKLIAENLLSNYTRVFNLYVTVFRIFSVYGPGLRKQLIWDVSQNALSASSTGQKKITLFGTGNETRDFIYVEDLCNAVLHVMDLNPKNKFELYNLASGVESTIKSVAESLIRHLKIDININFNGVVPAGDPANWRTDISKLSKLGFVPQHSLDQGLGKVAIWAKNSNK